MVILAEISGGELLDKISILEIKSERMTDQEKLANVRHELEVLSRCRDGAFSMSDGLRELYRQLKGVNGELWVIEDDIRECERKGDFGARFIELARAVYFTNDRRAALKKEISILTDSGVVEEKSYAPY